VSTPANTDSRATVPVRRAIPPIRRSSAAIIAALAVVAIAGGIGTWLSIGKPAPQTPVSAQRAAPAPSLTLAAPLPVVRLAAEAEIAADAAPTLTVFRFAPNRDILVLDFPNLLRQAHMLNRVAALIEKDGLPRDRVLDDAALADAIRASGEREETYYLGHDYSAEELTRFFAVADRDSIVLNPDETMLRSMLAREGFLQEGSRGALISVSRAGADPSVDAQARATILHHELSHGEYFSNPVYAAFARKFFDETMNSQDRAAFKRFLKAEGYDDGQDDLMINESQAYLMHTPDSRFFDAGALGLPPQELGRLRIAFMLGMPPGWLRDSTALPEPSAAPRFLPDTRHRKQ
jgi:hypothetical protein